MTDVQNPAPEAGDEAIADDVNVAVEQDDQGQVETPPAEGEQPEDDEKKSRSKERRERQRAYTEQLRQSEAQTRAEAQRAANRIREMEQAAQSLPQPKQTDYADFESYQAALTAFHTLRATDAREIDRAKREAKAAFDAVQEVERHKGQARLSAIQMIVEDGSSVYPDFHQVALSDGVRITNAMAEVIAETDAPGEVAYYLGKNPKIAAQLADMAPTQMARAIGRIEATMTASRQTVSSAPAPITPVRPKASARLDPDSMSMEEYRAARRSGKLR